jgi:adenine-specific DNA-methyltransferase
LFSIHNRRYTGSKLKLAEWVIDLIGKYCEGDSFFEIFAGTSVISSLLAPNMKHVILNDTLEANKVIYQAFYADGKWSADKINGYKAVFNSLEQFGTDNFFSNNYGDKYFSLADCKKIETIRARIEADIKSLTEKEYAILLASLIYSMDRCANTVGHFDAYIHSDYVADRFSFDLIKPFDFPNTRFTIFCEDANTIAQYATADIVYVDPPYNSRQYCQFYHIYETVIAWDKPELFGTALKPQGKHLSEYCRSKAPQVFAELIAGLNCRYIAVSYNNTYKSKSGSSRNKITLDDIKNILETKGAVHSFSKNHQFFNAGKTDFADHKEYLFITEVLK